MGGDRGCRSVRAATCSLTSRAPAKIILLGEHAVVYGQPAIAVPFTALAATVESRPAPLGSGITLRAHDINKEARLTASNPKPNGALAQTVQLVLTALNKPVPDVILDLRSTIPVASGLGSCAAVSTALIRELSAFIGYPLEGDRLNALVYEAEKLYHGTPSGIDNTVIVFERPLYFVRDAPRHAPPDRRTQSFRIGAPLTLIVADSGIPGATRETVAAVRQQFESDPARTVPIIDRIGELVNLGRRAIEEGDAETLGGLMLDNHRLLALLGVSLPVLDRIVAAARAAGALGAKLSGGGGGGNLIALVDAENAERVQVAMRSAGAVQTWQTTVK